MFLVLHDSADAAFVVLTWDPKIDLIIAIFALMYRKNNRNSRTN